MGILADTAEQDIDTLLQIAELSKSGWISFCQQNQVPEDQQFDLEINEGLIPSISDLGATILNKHFCDPTFMDRIATFVILANCCPFFKIQLNRKVVMDMQVRRTFVARLSCTFVQGALRKFVPVESNGYYHFEGFADPTKAARFITFLEFMDGVEIRNTATGAKKELVDHALKIFAKDIISVVTFLESEIKFISQDPALIDEPTV